MNIPYRPLSAAGYALIVWTIGFVWGTIVFMTPALSNIGSIEGISKMPAITIPLLIVIVVLTVAFTKRYLNDTKDKAEEAKLLGITFFAVNFVLDLALYLTLYDKDYYSYISIWISYALLLSIPYYIGKQMQISDKK